MRNANSVFVCFVVAVVGFGFGLVDLAVALDWVGSGSGTGSGRTWTGLDQTGLDRGTHCE